MIESIPCKICTSDSNITFHSGWVGQPTTFPYYSCSNAKCGFLQTNYLDNLSEEQVSDIYSSYWNEYTGTGEGRSQLPLEKVKLAEMLIPDVRKVLDIGSGEGWGVKTLQESGYEAYGYDIASPKMCHDSISVGSRDIVSGQYDVVTAVEVMEHLTDPIEACQWISRLVRPEGVFAFSTSTFNSKKHDSSWWYLKQVGHISLHTRSSLNLLARATGFRVVASIFSTHVWVHSDTVPLGSGSRIKLKHALKKALDKKSYRILKARMKNYGIEK
ncbi:MAG: class I SAM-dependent methyltransferase [Thermosynechococcaceae cyanobacterium]